MKALHKILGQTIATTTFRVAAISIALFVIVAGLITGLVFRQTTTTLRDQVLTALDADIKVLSEIASSSGQIRLIDAVAERARAGAGLYLLTEANGTKIAGNLNTVPVQIEGQPAGGTFQYQPLGTSDTDGATRLAVARPIKLAGLHLYVGRDIEAQRQALQRIWVVFLAGLAALAIAGVGVGLYMSRNVLARVDTMAAASRRIMAGDLTKRIPLHGTDDELDGLALSLNAMLARIEQLMDGLREVSDNIAHDLKTPLNRLRNRAEAALRDARGPEAHREGLELTIEAADELISTFNALLLIAKLEAGAIEETLRDIDIGVVVADVAEFYEPVAEESGLAVVTTIEAGLNVSANKQLVGQAVANLIDNAIKYSAPAAGNNRHQLTVSVEVSAAGEMIEIIVADQGRGIERADRERALRRFVRLEKSRTAPGTGLGLSLVAAVARLHKGCVRLEDNSPGLRAILELPRAKPMQPKRTTDVEPGRQGAPALSTGS